MMDMDGDGCERWWWDKTMKDGDFFLKGMFENMGGVEVVLKSYLVVVMNCNSEKTRGRLLSVEESTSEWLVTASRRVTGGDGTRLLRMLGTLP